MKRFKLIEPSPLTLVEHVGGEWVRYEDHCDAMKRMAREPEGLAVADGAEEEKRRALILAATSCPHEIDSNRVILHYDSKQPGHNALAQLADRLVATPPAAMSAERDQAIDQLASTLSNVHKAVCEVLGIDPEADDSLPELVADWKEENDARIAALSASAQQDERGALSDETTQPWYDAAWEAGATSHTSFAGDELESLTFTPREFEAFCSSLLAQQVQAEGAKPVAITREQIRNVFLANGFTVKPGHDDLKEYVYEAASALIGLAWGCTGEVTVAYEDDEPSAAPATEGASTGALTDEQIEEAVIEACHSDPLSSIPGEYRLTLDEIRSIVGLLSASPAKENSK